MAIKPLLNGAVFFSLTLLSWGAGVAHADDVVLQRPLLENYSDYNQFLIDMAAYRKQQHDIQERERLQAQQSAADASQDAARPAETVVVTPSVNPDDETLPPPLAVNGPEDLDDAIAAAKRFPHPTYHRKVRFNRSTSQSFALPQLNAHDMATTEVSGMWSSDTPMPDNVMELLTEVLDRECVMNAELKMAYRTVFAARQSVANEDEQIAEDYRIKDLALPAQPHYTPQPWVFYPFSHDLDGSITGLVRLSGTTEISVHDKVKY